MKRFCIALSATAVVLALASSGLRADVRADEKGKVEFAGMLGRIVNIFGGRAARNGVSTSRMVKGDRMAAVTDNTEQIVDLREEKIYDLDLKKKTYKVTTFEELRQQMQEAMDRAKEQAKKEPEAAAQPEPAADERQMDVDFDVKETGERKAINGFDTHEAIMTITFREKGKTLEESGGMVVTSDLWLTSTIAAMKEILDFQIRYAKQLAGPMVAGASPEQMGAAIAMYPMMKPAMARLSEEGAKLQGTAIQTVTTIDAVKSAEQMAEERKAQADSSQSSGGAGIGGLVGGLARRAARRNQEAPSARTTVMTTTTELLKVATTVADTDVAIPVGFKEAK